MKICLIEDDLDLGAALQAALEEQSYDVVWLRRAVDALRWLADQDFDVALLDIGLPDDSGFNVLREIRNRGDNTPVLIISARDALDDRLLGLDIGADDYLVKPFAIAELISRLRAIIRRANAMRDTAWHVRELEISEKQMLVQKNSVPLNLSPIEYGILLELMRHADQVVTRRKLIANCMSDSEGQSLDVHISNLRRKIGNGYIRTVRGVGYVIDLKDLKL